MSGPFLISFFSALLYFPGPHRKIYHRLVFQSALYENVLNNISPGVTPEIALKSCAIFQLVWTGHVNLPANGDRPCPSTR